jgi:probable F420-dependent oxidoreductase
VKRYGITFPLETVPLAEQKQWVGELEDLGYTDLWGSEAQDLDGFVPLALASQWTQNMRLGCAVLPAQTRGPAVLAQSAAAMALAAPGRFVLGLGCSSPYIVEMQNARPFENVNATMRDVVRFTRAALAGEDPNGDYETFKIAGFHLRRALDHPPPILLAALRPAMLEIAARDGDGAILQYLVPEDYSLVLPLIKKHGADKEVAQRLIVCPSENADAVRKIARWSMSIYMSVPNYRKHQQWLGNSHMFEEMWACFDRGDLKAARRAIPDDVVDRYYIHGSSGAIKDRIAQYVDAGLETPILALVENVVDPIEGSRLLAPN